MALCAKNLFPYPKNWMWSIKLCSVEIEIKDGSRSNSPYLGCCVTLTGRALAEAALGGVPIVAYDIDWHSEAVETGVTGELVPYSNYSLMADAVEKIINDEEYGQMIGKNARKRMLKIMDPEANDKVMKDMYENLLNPKSS